MRNKINKNCLGHRKLCDRFCIYSKCQNKILCQKCVREHQLVHPSQFIYTIQNLCQTHSFDKLSKMKEVLGKFKVITEQRIIQMYAQFNNILEPLNVKIRQFQKQSKQLIVQQLYAYLYQNKEIIQNIKIQKSDTNSIMANPQQMIDQIIKEVQIITQKQCSLKKNRQQFVWHVDATEQLCISAQKQINALIGTACKLLDKYKKIQISKYEDNGNENSKKAHIPFYQKYVGTHEVAAKKEKNSLQITIAEIKYDLQRKDSEMKQAISQINSKQLRIEELDTKVTCLRDEISQWQQRADRDERQRRQRVMRQRKKLQEQLVRHDVITESLTIINLSKRPIKMQNFQLIFELIPNPVQLRLNYHQLTKLQLDELCKFTSLKILRMSFMPKCEKSFLMEALKGFENLHTLQLNSCKMDDQTLKQISTIFPPKLKHLYLMDNLIGDQGIESMLVNTRSLFDQRYTLDIDQEQRKNLFESLYLSFNQLTGRCVEIIARCTPKIKTLHLSKIQIKNKGAISIGKSLLNLQQLFIGGTGVQKQGLMSICRGCIKIKKLCLVQTQISAQMILDILSHLKTLEWLDVRHSPTLNQQDIQKIQKFKIIYRCVDIQSRN